MAELNIDELRAKSIHDLIPLLLTWDIGQFDAQREAQRQAIKAVIDEKLTSSLAQTINALNRSTTRLTIVGWVLSIIGVIAGIIVPLYLKK